MLKLKKPALKNKKYLVWVDLNILPLSGKSIGSQIVSLDNNPLGLKTSCNPNIINISFNFTAYIFEIYVNIILFLTKNDNILLDL